MAKTVLITGASKGIGFAISKLLNESGYKVVGLARNSIQDKFPGELILCDLFDRKQTGMVLLEIQKKFPDIDHIINNVGISLPQAIGEIDLEYLDRVFDLNVRTTVQVTQAFIEDMKNKEYGRIVNIGSRAIFGAKNRSSYSAAKSALIGLTRTWALELAKYKITVNAVSPGPTETELFRKTRPVGSVAEKEILDSIPLGRLGYPEEVAMAVKFLISDEASFITGQNLCVDGGGSL